MKDQKSNKSLRSDIDNLIETLAKSVSDDPDQAKEYLKEQNYNLDQITGEGLAMIQGFKAKRMIEVGADKQNWMQEMLDRFVESVKTNFDSVQKDLLLRQVQVNFRSLETLEEAEIDRLCEDVGFLDYLEECYSEKDKNND